MAENIFLGRECRRYGLLDWGRMNAEAAELLRRFAVEIDVRRPLMNFSTAVQQMVAIARAVSFKARLVIMDEPTSSLDEREVSGLFEVMRRLRAEGIGDHLHQPSARQALPGLRPGHGDARRPLAVTASQMAEIDKLHLIAAMLGRDLETVRARSTRDSPLPSRLRATSYCPPKGFGSGRKVQDARVEVRRASDRWPRRAPLGSEPHRGGARDFRRRPAGRGNDRDRRPRRFRHEETRRSDRARRRLLQRGPQGGWDRLPTCRCART